MSGWEKLFIVMIVFSLIRGAFVRIRSHRAMNYQAYLKTPHWKKKRKKIIARDKHCMLCGSTEHLVVHHNNYKNIGHEHDGDLVCLCSKHHNAYHAYERSQGRR